MLIARHWVVVDRQYRYPLYCQTLPWRRKGRPGGLPQVFKGPANAQDLLETYIEMGAEQDSMAFSLTIWAKIGKVASVHLGKYREILVLFCTEWTHCCLPPCKSGSSETVWTHRTWRKFETSFSHMEIRFCRVCLGLQSDWAIGFFVLFLHLSLKLLPEFGCLVSLVLSCVVLVVSSSLKGWSGRTWL